MSGSKGQGSGPRRRCDRPGAGPVRRPVSTYRDPTHRLVYVAAEGAKTEGDYITLLNRAYGEKKRFHLHFCKHRDSNGLRPVEVVRQVVNEADRSDDEKWALFDRDAGDKTPEEIREAMRLAAEHGVHVALSHPSFELWLLLHFKQHTSTEGGMNTTVLDRLGLREPLLADRRGRGLASLLFEENGTQQHLRVGLHGHVRRLGTPDEAPKFGFLKGDAKAACRGDTERLGSVGLSQVLGQERSQEFWHGVTGP